MHGHKRAEAPVGEPAIRVALVGLGRIMREDHLPAVLASGEVSLDSVCDPDIGTLEQLPPRHSVPTFTTLDELLSRRRPEAAIVAVPHDQYLSVISKLAAAGVHVLKEKPLAVSLAEAIELDRIVKRSGIRLMVTLQRRFNPLFRSFGQLRHYIGRIFYFDFRYTLNIKHLDIGWRGQRRSAGGGTLIDMGYHTVDLLLWYFGLPATVQASLVTGGREQQEYDVEDTCSLQLVYDNGFFGNLFLSRVFPAKQETLLVAGTRGLVELDRFRIRRVSTSGDVVEELTRTGEWPSAYLDQLNTFAQWVRDPGAVPELEYHSHFEHVALIEAAYRSAQTGTAVSPTALLKEHGIPING